MSDAPASDRPMNDGPMNDSPMNDGPMNDSPMNDRPMNDRAVSDLIGFILIFSLVVSVVAVVSLVGMDSLQSARDVEQTNNAERAMEVLADNMADIYERGAPSRATEISLEDNSLHLDEPVTIEVRDPVGPDDESFLVNRSYSVRPVVYDDGDTRLVYVMGAVFRDQQRGGTVLRSWSPILDEDRTLLPVINTVSATDTRQSVKSSTVLVRAHTNRRVVAVADESGSYDDVWINVTSPRRDLWEEMLSEHSELSCSTSGPDTVKCELDGYVPERLYVIDTRIAVDLKK